MAIIKDYKFADGHVEDVECTEEFKREYEKMEKHDRYIDWRERQLNPIRIDAYDSNVFDIEDPVNRNPEEICLEREQEEFLEQQEQQRRALPMLNCLTEYQKRVAIMYYIEKMPQAEIAKAEGVSKKAISKLMQKIQKKVVKYFA